MIEGWPKREGREETEPADDEDHRDEQPDEGEAGGGERSRRCWRDLLPDHAAGDEADRRFMAAAIRLSRSSSSAIRSLAAQTRSRLRPVTSWMMPAQAGQRRVELRRDRPRDSRLARPLTTVRLELFDTHPVDFVSNREGLLGYAAVLDPQRVAEYAAAIETMRP